MLYDKLYDWQKPIVDALSEKRAYGLFLDMGLGKTVQALAIAEKLESTKILVITKNAKACETVDTPGSWHRWSLELDGFQILSKKDQPRRYDSSDRIIYIINYEAVFDRSTPGNKGDIRLKQEMLSFIDLCKNQRVTLILDESHSIKDASTSQAKALAKIKSLLKLKALDLHTYLLTGTPFTTGFIDLYNQLKFLGCPMKKAEFKDRFCVIGNVRGLLGWQQPIVGYKHLDELYALIHQYAVTIKTEAIELLTAKTPQKITLPDQVFEKHLISSYKDFKYLTKKTISADEFDTLNRARKQEGLPYFGDDYEPALISESRIVNPWWRNAGAPLNDFAADTPALLWLRARQLSIGFQGSEDGYLWFDDARMKAIEKFLDEHRDNYVLFYNYVPEFLKLFDIADGLGYNVDVYNGPIKSLHFYEKFARQSEADRLINKGNIILANFASGSTGMNWQLYNKCVIASLPLYKDWAQGLKRVHRIGSTDTVVYHLFIGDNWLDSDMWDSLQEGVEYSEELFNRKLNEIQSA